KAWVVWSMRWRSAMPCSRKCSTPSRRCWSRTRLPSSHSVAAAAVVHCHFYQPPRENPWLDEVEAEPSAAPFHDWNARITHQCYEPFAAARLLDDAGRTIRRINLYEWVSFDVGTTLARWLERSAADTS